MNQLTATALGFVLASLVAATAIGLGIATTLDAGSVWDALTWVGIAFVFTFGVSAVVALPIFVALNRCNMVKWWTACLGGAICGATSLALFPSVSAEVVLVGAGSGVVFWSV